MPVEKDCAGKFIGINIDEEPREFRQDFTDAIKIKDWGKILSGNYLGWYDSIKGKYIDLFAGEGKLDETFCVTSYDNKVCQ
ncbi:hypothetical protein [Nitrosopumilus ureiphilus]|uniref:Uncharacterized protein n=1 Tax=Nitrosopumilus ureiphilus TaxID=1470067 RepID=A0A7D5M3F1_9ARCH|nr:hypothetical protein [Nitrosopumilus ureiphilus]QLH06214.1 hypothetical protein C5F50_03315 [Nitrosopumilus ureiphilus]